MYATLAEMKAATAMTAVCAVNTAEPSASVDCTTYAEAADRQPR
jgi:hypothetical protein